MKEFIARVESAYKNAPPDMKVAVKELTDVAAKFDAGFGGFVYKGRAFALIPPEDPSDTFFLIAMQIDCLARVYEKSHLEILADVNEALKIIRDVE